MQHKTDEQLLRTQHSYRRCKEEQ